MGKLTKEEIEQTLQDIYGKEEWIQRCEWEEDGKIYHCWKISIPATENTRAVDAITNDAGMAQIHEAIKKDLENYDKKNSPKT